MADLTRDHAFNALVEATLTIINHLSSAGVPDAMKLVRRSRGWNNLQGHFRGLVPLAVWFFRFHPHHLEALRRNTSLRNDMGLDRREARRADLWQPIQEALLELLAARGGDVIAPPGSRTDSAVSASGIAESYLSESYGGRQFSGGGGDTVLKRTLKLLAHVLPH